MSSLHRTLCFSAWLVVTATVNVQAEDEATGVPFYRQIDSAIQEAHVGPHSPLVGDHEFLRRVYLNLIGRIPRVPELEAFVAADDPGKRGRTVERLLESTEFAEYFTGVLDIMLMERRSGTRISQSEWTDFLRHCLDERWPMDRIVREIISADGHAPFRGAAKFLVQRQVEPNALTRDIGRIFLGRDLQCAQCHDHPNIMDYEQAEYYGILSFVHRSYLFEDDNDNKKSYVGERANGEAEYASVFLPEDGSSRSLPHLLGGLTLEVEPQLSEEDAYVVAPSKSTAAVPKFSRRIQLARIITHPANEHFAKNFANRFWAHMMGKGLVHPVDFHHSDNPATHPKLLQLLADNWVTMQFDIRELLRQIALSDTYQRSIDMPVFGENVTQAKLDEQATRWEAALAQADSHGSSSAVPAHQLRLRRAALQENDDQLAVALKAGVDLREQRSELKKELEKLRTNETSLQKQLRGLQDARKAAGKVAKLLPDDSALSETYDNYQRREKSVSLELEAKQQSIQGYQEKLTGLDKEQAASAVRVARLQAERVGLADMVAEARGAAHVRRVQKRRRHAAELELKQRLSTFPIYRDYLSKRARLRSLAVQVDELQSKLAQTDSNVNSATPLAEVAGKIESQQAGISQIRQRATAVRELLNISRGALASIGATATETRMIADELSTAELSASWGSLRETQRLLTDQFARLSDLAQSEDQKLTQAEEELTNLVAKADSAAANASLMAKQEQLDALASEITAITAEVDLVHGKLRKSWERRYVVRSLVPLSPEQLAGSTIAALGLQSRFLREAESEWLKAHKEDDSESEAEPKETDIETRAAKVRELQQKRIDQVRSTYVSVFAAPGGSPQDVFSATADQALFMSNDGRFQGWLSPAEGTLMAQLQSEDNPQQLANTMYLSILSRPAESTEVEYVSGYLQQRTDDRTKAIQELAWGLLTSVEYRFNH